jgi:hypothetical protein
VKAILIIAAALLVLAHPAVAVAILAAELGAVGGLAVLIARRRPFRTWLYVRRLA